MDGTKADEGLAQRVWTVATSDGGLTVGHLPYWSSWNPSVAGVEPPELPRVLEEVNLSGILFDAELLPSRCPDDGGPCVVFGASIECNPFADDATRVPAVTVHVTEDESISGLGPDDVVDVARKLRTVADRLENLAVPALLLARQDWTEHAGPEPNTSSAPAAPSGQPTT
jgi:hypothetical protein